MYTYVGDFSNVSFNMQIDDIVELFCKYNFVGAMIFYTGWKRNGREEKQKREQIVERIHSGRGFNEESFRVRVVVRVGFFKHAIRVIERSRCCFRFKGLRIPPHENVCFNRHPKRVEWVSRDSHDFTRSRKTFDVSSNRWETILSKFSVSRCSIREPTTKHFRRIYNRQCRFASCSTNVTKSSCKLVTKIKT